MAASAFLSPRTPSDFELLEGDVLSECRLRLVPSNSTAGRGGKASLIVEIPSPTYYKMSERV